jgi:CheY-like chemotaxis protein
MTALRWFGKKGRSSEKELGRLVSRNLYREVVATVPDWRDRFRVAAERVGSSEMAMMEEIARALGLPFVSELGDLEAVCGVTLEESLGVAYLEADGDRRAIVCIDPIRLDFMPKRGADHEICLSTWTEIRAVYGGLMGERNVSRKIYDLVVGEARSHGATSVHISPLGEYSFVTGRGEQACGAISAAQVQSFIRYLEQRGEKLTDSGFRIAWPDLVSRDVWIVDDDRDFAELVRGILVRQGHSVATYTDPTVALACLDRLGDEELVLVVDQNMAKMQGLEFARRLLEGGARERFKIIMVTSAASPELFTAALKSGVEVCVDKAQDLSVLAAYVEQRSQRSDSGGSHVG